MHPQNWTDYFLAVSSYAEAANPNDSGETDPYILTRLLAKSAWGNGARVLIGCAAGINYADDKERVKNCEKRVSIFHGILSCYGSTDHRWSAGNRNTESVIVRLLRDASSHVFCYKIASSPKGRPDRLSSADLHPR